MNTQDKTPAPRGVGASRQTWAINTVDVWDEDYGEPSGVTITIDRNPAELTQADWEALSEWVEGTFPLSSEAHSHGLSPNTAEYFFED